jgi:hypothetical protein
MCNAYILESDERHVKVRAALEFILPRPDSKNCIPVAYASYTLGCTLELVVLYASEDTLFTTIAACTGQSLILAEQRRSPYSATQRISRLTIRRAPWHAVAVTVGSDECSGGSRGSGISAF